MWPNREQVFLAAKIPKKNHVQKGPFSWGCCLLEGSPSTEWKINILFPLACSNIDFSLLRHFRLCEICWEFVDFSLLIIRLHSSNVQCCKKGRGGQRPFFSENLSVLVGLYVPYFWTSSCWDIFKKNPASIV